MKDDRASGHVPAHAAEIAGQLLGILDQGCPGGVSGFYLVGSIALGDYRPGRSDIDFLAVIEPTFDVSTLAGVHSELAEICRPLHCDGIYLQRHELSAAPRGTGPSAREGRVTLQSRDERHPVTWLTLLHHGKALRGPLPDRSWIAADVDAAIAYSRENIRSYWRPWLQSYRQSDGYVFNDAEVTWGALGIARLHALITTGGIESKTSAGLQALTAFPRHSRLIREALGIRDGRKSSFYASKRRRSNDLVRFLDDAIAAMTA